MSVFSAGEGPCICPFPSLDLTNIVVRVINDTVYVLLLCSRSPFTCRCLNGVLGLLPVVAGHVSRLRAGYFRDVSLRRWATRFTANEITSISGPEH